MKASVCATQPVHRSSNHALRTRADRAALRRHGPVFVVGCARSGTSLLRDILAANSDVGSPPSESKFFERFNQRYGDLQDNRNLDRLCDDFFRSEFFRFTGLPEPEIKVKVQRAERTYKSFLSTVMQSYLDIIGKKVWVEKTPSHAFHVNDIVALFPDARVLFIVRDGRDVSLSVRKIYFDPSQAFRNPVMKTLVTALWWRRFHVEPLSRCLELDSDSWRIVEFERLVTERESYISRIFEFLDVSGSIGESPIGSWPADKPTLRKANSSFDDIRGISSRPVGRWREMMGKDESAAFELVCSDLLSLLGYDVADDSLLVGARAVAGAVMDSPVEALRLCRGFRGTVSAYRSSRRTLSSLELSAYKL